MSEEDNDTASASLSQLGTRIAIAMHPRLAYMRVFPRIYLLRQGMGLEGLFPRIHLLTASVE